MGRNRHNRSRGNRERGRVNRPQPQRPRFSIRKGPVGDGCDGTCPVHGAEGEHGTIIPLDEIIHAAARDYFSEISDLLTDRYWAPKSIALYALANNVVCAKASQVDTVLLFQLGVLYMREYPTEAREWLDNMAAYVVELADRASRRVPGAPPLTLADYRMAERETVETIREGWINFGRERAARNAPNREP